jgi:hypothetical protein
MGDPIFSPMLLRAEKVVTEDTATAGFHIEELKKVSGTLLSKLTWNQGSWTG